MPESMSQNAIILVPMPLSTIQKARVSVAAMCASDDVEKWREETADMLDALGIGKKIEIPVDLDR